MTSVAAVARKATLALFHRYVGTCVLVKTNVRLASVGSRRDEARRVLVNRGARVQGQRKQPQLRQQERSAASSSSANGGERRFMVEDTLRRSRIRRSAAHASTRLSSSMIIATAAARPASRFMNAVRYMNSDITSVARAGPPPVSGRMRSKVLSVAIVMSIRLRAATGAICGHATTRKRASGPSPSRSAASCSSRGIRCSAAYRGSC